jgi:hypothetical protein
MNRKRSILLLAFCCVIAATCLLAGCESDQIIKRPLTHKEEDYYTITNRDTTVREAMHNVPGGSADSTPTQPSSRTNVVHAETSTYDSVADRYYPNFLRAGGFEIAGLTGSSSTNGIGTGLFGLFSIFDREQVKDSGTLWNHSGAGKLNGTPHIVKGELARFMPLEYRLRWFNDAPNWTIGWSLAELLAPDEVLGHHALVSIGSNVYVRRRFYIRDQIPYIIFSPFFGASLYPSMYINVGGEMQLGSLAGLNLRAYAGIASGFWWGNPKDNVAFSYVGLGVSVFDFTNRVEEMQREWKDYVNTGINFNVLEGSMFRPSTTYPSAFSDTTLNLAWQLKFASVEVPLPFANYHFWAGTSLVNWMSFGLYQQGLGVLPIRAGYRQYLFSESLMLEPFLELNYYPSQFFNVGARAKLDTHTGTNIGFTAGYASGTPGSFSPQIFNSGGAEIGSSFSAAYFGISVFLGDWNYTPETVRDSRAKEIPSTIQ